jgi:sugar phosphate isomerase/epimerase
MANPERRDFLRKLIVAGSGVAVIPSLISCNTVKKSGYMTDIGVCTSVGNAGIFAPHGYDFIEESVGRFLVPAESEDVFLQKLEIASKSPLPVRACNGFIPGMMKSVGPYAVHREILEYVSTAFRRSQQAGIEYIVFGSGGSRRVPEGFPWQEALEQFVSLAKQMAPIAGEHNVTIVLEPLRRAECNFVNTVAYGARITEMVDHPNFLLLADLYHMLDMNESPESIINHGSLISHMHIAELEGRSMPGTHGEDFTPYFKAMKETGYKGMISMEGRWNDMEAQAPVALDAMQQQMRAV